jgi:FkbM family methyltransferase
MSTGLGNQARGGRLTKLLRPFYRKLLQLRRSHRRLVDEIESGFEAAARRIPRPKRPTFTCAELRGSSGQPFKMMLLRPGLIEDAIFRHGAWEPELCDLMRFFMKRDGIFIDIGSNIGFHSLSIAGAMPDARCLAFEPNPAVFRHLLANITLNDHLPNVSAHELAVSSHCNDLEFFAQDESDYNRGLSSTALNHDLDSAAIRRIKVQATTLDAFLDDSLKHLVSVIKIDTQGNEEPVLRGAAETLRLAQPVVFFEFEARYHPDNPEARLRQLLDLLPGYRFLLVTRDGTGSATAFDPAEICRIDRFEGDFVCLPPRFSTTAQPLTAT